jgi:hypothetical protein
MAVVLLTLLLVLPWFVWSQASVPEPSALGQRIRAALKLDYQLLKGFTYLERRRDIKISKLGKVTIGPLRTFEVHPSDQYGGTYKRLIAIDGKPLPPDELARRDAEHENDLRQAHENSRNPRVRATREHEAAEAHRHREAMIDDAVAVFEPTIVGHEWIDGQRVLVADAKPRQDARVRTREGRWMKRFAGRMWVAEADYQIVKLDMRAFDDVTVAWGVVGRLHKGSQVMIARRYVMGTWVPAERTYSGSGRTLLFRPFEFAVTTTYSDYKKR